PDSTCCHTYLSCPYDLLDIHDLPVLLQRQALYLTEDLCARQVLRAHRERAFVASLARRAGTARPRGSYDEYEPEQHRPEGSTRESHSCLDHFQFLSVGTRHSLPRLPRRPGRRGCDLRYRLLDAAPVTRTHT